MTTEKPKVSAYVPQAIKDQLKVFCERYDLSESSAVSSILAEYFGMQGDECGTTLARLDEIFNRLIAVEEKTSAYPELKAEELSRISALEAKVQELQDKLNTKQDTHTEQVDPLEQIFNKHYGNGISNNKKARSR